MILIIGGAYQGKTEFAVKNFGILESEIAEGADNIETLLSAKCIRNFENFVFEAVQNGGDPLAETSRILAENPDVIILMTEIGSGIIPIEKAERIKREATGKVGCLLAEKADTVIRLTCGIPQILKGKLR